MQSECSRCLNIFYSVATAEKIERDGNLFTTSYELFAECPIAFESKENTKIDHFIQPVADSSRYFVVRFEVYIFLYILIFCC